MRLGRRGVLLLAMGGSGAYLTADAVLNPDSSIVAGLREGRFLPATRPDSGYGAGGYGMGGYGTSD